MDKWDWLDKWERIKSLVNAFMDWIKELLDIVKN